MSASETSTGTTGGRYFEEFRVGETLVTGGRTIGEGLVDAFAGMTGDFSYVHTDAEAARSTPFGERVAHGLLSLAVAQGLIWQTGYTAGTGVATLGWRDVRFPAPVRFGDTVHVELVIAETRASESRPTMGILVESCRMLNQHGHAVLTAEHVLMVRRRPPRR